MSGPLTLEQVRIILQNALNTGDENTVKYYIQILDRLKVQVNYTEESEEELLNKKKIRAKEIFVGWGLSKADAQSIINNNQIKENETAEVYAQRMKNFIDTRNRSN